MAVTLAAYSRTPVHAANCGGWYNACANACSGSQYSACMDEFGDTSLCQGMLSQCYSFCQATYFDCLSTGDAPGPYCVPVGFGTFTEWICA